MRSLCAVHAATRPLLRQIENLQTAHATQSANWEKVESSLTQRLGKELWWGMATESWSLDSQVL